jgi:hypothetical protein
VKVFEPASTRGGNRKILARVARMEIGHLEEQMTDGLAIIKCIPVVQIKF